MFLNLNFTDYLRNSGAYSEAVDIDLYNFKIIKQLNCPINIYAKFLFNIGLDYFYLNNSSNALLYLLDCLKYNQFINKSFPKNSYSYYLIKYIKARYDKDHILCDEIVEKINNAYFSDLSFGEKVEFIKLAINYYDCIDDNNKYVYYIKKQKNFI